MLIRVLLLPALLVGAFALVAPEADASPISGFDSKAYGGRIYVGGAVGVPVGRRRAVRRARWVGGYYKTVYETRVERVWHGPELIGYDSHGHAVYSRGHYDEVQVQVPVRVWVPRRRVVHRVRPRARGYVAVGGTFRVR